MGAPPGRLERYTFLVERSLGKRVAHALEAHGFTVVQFAEQFRDETPDEEWIARAAEERWVVLTKDSEVRRRQYSAVSRPAVAAALSELAISRSVAVY